MAATAAAAVVASRNTSIEFIVKPKEVAASESSRLNVIFKKIIGFVFGGNFETTSTSYQRYGRAFF